MCTGLVGGECAVVNIALCVCAGLAEWARTAVDRLLNCEAMYLLSWKFSGHDSTSRHASA
eukprot:COSAG02_NODE_46443_length_349_cov_0.460000_1_plen_59_part_10